MAAVDQAAGRPNLPLHLCTAQVQLIGLQNANLYNLNLWRCRPIGLCCRMSALPNLIASAHSLKQMAMGLPPRACAPAQSIGSSSSFTRNAFRHWAAKRPIFALLRSADMAAGTFPVFRY